MLLRRQARLRDHAGHANESGEICLSGLRGRCLGICGWADSAGVGTKRDAWWPCNKHSGDGRTSRAAAIPRGANSFRPTANRSSNKVQIKNVARHSEMMSLRSNRSAACPANNDRHRKGRNCESPMRPRSSTRPVSLYTCHPTATMSICAAIEENSRAQRYRVKSRCVRTAKPPVAPGEFKDRGRSTTRVHRAAFPGPNDIYARSLQSEDR